MKKVIYVLSCILILSGCSLGTKMDNTPTKQVEKYLNNYQTLSSNILSEIDSIVDGEVQFEEKQKDTYRDLLKKHFQDLTYNVKEETVNGDKATVEVEIEVNDYTRVLKTAESYKATNESEFYDENNQYDESKYIDYKLKMIGDNTDKVKYTIYFSLTKVDDDWTLDSLTNTEQEKLLGIYEY